MVVRRVIFGAMKESGVHVNVINQDHLKEALHQIFPYDNIVTNVRKGASIVNPKTGKYLELDFWIPVLNLCFEFQDEYHYVTTWYSQNSIKQIKNSDEFKRENVRKKKDTLIEVPYWWSGSADSLLATLQFSLPDVGSHATSFPLIPLNPPPTSKFGVPHVGELMLASFPQSASFHQSISSKNSWWLGEKYDGIRVCWNAVTKCLYTRSGGEVELPSSFYRLFPNSFIDAEIWFGRGMFTETQKIVHIESRFIHFHYSRIIGFDVPPAEMNNMVFEKRFKILLKIISFDHPLILTAGREMCKTPKQMKERVREITTHAGEGVILRRPHSFYFHGRSNSLLKLKAYRADKEGIVVAVHKSGALTLKLPEGMTISVGAHHVDLPCPPSIGDIVSFSFENFSFSSSSSSSPSSPSPSSSSSSSSSSSDKNVSFSPLEVPVNPRVYQIRKDLVWDELVSESASVVSMPLSLNETSTKPSGEKQSKQSGFWTADNGKNTKKFLEKIAKQKGLDPRDPSTWYSFKREWIDKETGGATIMDQFKGGMVNLFLSLFPDIGLDETKFEIRNQFFQEVKNRRQWFDNFAKRNGFNPHLPENWYSITSDKILSQRGSKSVLHHHKNNFIKALISLYPEIGLQENKFSSTIVFYMDDEKHRKEFFMEYAQKRGIDVLRASDWYRVTRADVCSSMKGARRVLGHYGDSLVQALITLFPHVNLHPDKFVAVPKSYWTNPLNRRKVFEEFANKEGFDPLLADNWYSISYGKLRSVRTIAVCLSYGGTRYKVLSQIFPELEFDESKFKKRYEV